MKVNHLFSGALALASACAVNAQGMHRHHPTKSMKAASAPVLPLVKLQATVTACEEASLVLGRLASRHVTIGHATLGPPLNQQVRLPGSLAASTTLLGNIV
jgi:hypothetical protein